MSDYQYCECGRGLNPEPEDIVKGTILCDCGEDVSIVYLEDARANLMIQLLTDVQYLKETVDDLKTFLVYP